MKIIKVIFGNQQKALNFIISSIDHVFEVFRFGKSILIGIIFLGSSSFIQANESIRNFNTSITSTTGTDQSDQSHIGTKESFKYFMAGTLSISAGVSASAVEVFRGMFMVEESGKSLRERLLKDPNNLNLRLNFAGFDAAQKEKSWPTENPQGDENILWLIKNHPELDLPGIWSKFFIHSGKYFYDAKKTWINHVVSHGENINILCSAADYFIYTEPERSEELLDRVRRIDSKNSIYKAMQMRFDSLMRSRGVLEERGKLKSISLGGNIAEIVKMPPKVRVELNESTFFDVPKIQFGPQNLKNVVIGKITDPKEFSADIYIVIDDKNFNVLAQVRQKQSTYKKEDKSHLYLADSVEIWISGQAESRRYPHFGPGPQDYYLIIAPTSNTGQPAFSTERVDDKNVILKYHKTHWGYSLLASFPLANFYGQEWVVGKSYRFECAVTKTDGKGEKDAKIFWNSESDDVWKSPDLRGVVAIRAAK